MFRFIKYLQIALRCD